MAKCYVCGGILNENTTTEEHIFLNAIGGHLKSKDLICKKCNSTFGNEIDTVLAKQFNFIANMFNIKRDRGTPQTFDAVNTQDGSTYSLAPGGKPFRKKPICVKINNTYRITASNRKQARTLLNGLKRKHPEIDTNAILNSATTHTRYLDNELRFSIWFGGTKAFRSLCKTAVNFYLYKGGLSKNVHHLIPYIKSGVESHPVVNYFYLDKPPFPTTSTEVLHSIIIKGDSYEKILFAYIELFDFYKVIIMLNDNYEEESIEYSYFFDVLSHKEVARDYELSLSKVRIDQALINGISYTDITQKLLPQLNIVIDKALKKQSSEHTRTLIETGVNNALMKISGKNLTIEEEQEIFLNETMQQLTPWIIRLFKKEPNFS